MSCIILYRLSFNTWTIRTTLGDWELGVVGQVGREVYKLRCGGEVELIERTVFKRLKPM